MPFWQNRWDMWRTWCRDHPITILYLVVVTTANFLLAVLEAVK